MADLDCLWRHLKGGNLLFAKVIEQCVHSIKEGEVALYPQSMSKTAISLVLLKQF